MFLRKDADLNELFDLFLTNETEFVNYYLNVFREIIYFFIYKITLILGIVSKCYKL